MQQDKPVNRSRREFLATTSLSAMGLALLGRQACADGPPPPDLANCGDPGPGMGNLIRGVF